jgi:hypothetical protein
MSRWVLGIGLSASVASLALYAMTVGVPDQSSEIPNEMETIYASMLKQAEFLANHDRLAQAIQEIQGIPRNSRYFIKVQQFQESWSKEVLQQALEQYRRGNLDQAISLLKPIPSGTSIASQVQKFRTTWTQEARYLNLALSAATNRDWSNTLRSLEVLRGTETYTTPRVQTLIEQAITNAFDPSVTTIRLATAPSIQSAPSTQSTSPLTRFAPLKLVPLAIDTEKAIAQSEPQTATEVVIKSPNPSRTVPVPVTPVLPIPYLPPAPTISSELRLTQAGRSELTQAPVTPPQERTPDAILTSSQMRTSAIGLPQSPANEHRNSGAISQDSLIGKKRPDAPQPTLQSRRHTIITQIQQSVSPQTETTQTQIEQSKAQHSQQVPHIETVLPKPLLPATDTVNQPVQEEVIPSKFINTDLITRLRPATLTLPLKPLDTQTLQRVTSEKTYIFPTE